MKQYDYVVVDLKNVLEELLEFLLLFEIHVPAVSEVRVLALLKMF
jgi:hypothetical protein